MPIDPVVFLDTSYIYGLVNSRDQWHLPAVQWEKRVRELRCQLVTTEFILVEIADGLSAVRFRQQAIRILNSLSSSRHVTVLPASSQLYNEGIELFGARQDKAWGLTDCISFVAMEGQSLKSALTTDEHFVQAGFRALLLEDQD